MIFNRESYDIGRSGPSVGAVKQVCIQDFVLQLKTCFN